MTKSAYRHTVVKRIVGQIQKDYREQTFLCLCPACHQPAIRSHSQQKEGQLRAIAKDGKVYAISQNTYQYIKHAEPEQRIVPLKVVSIGEASTFPGYCDQHDQVIFAPIEKEPLDPERKDQAALFFLRTISQEYAAKRQASFFFRELPARMGPLLHPAHREHIHAWALGVDLFLNREGPFYLKSIFDMICKSHYDHLQVVWTRLDHTLGASTCTGFCPWLDDHERKWSFDTPQPLVSFTISPGTKTTDIVISWLAQHEQDASWIREHMRSKRGIEYMLNLCVAESADCCFGIDFWECLDGDTKRVVMENMRHNSSRGPIAKLPRILRVL